MKVLYKLSAGYAILGLLGGVFYREFTKLQAFEGTTSLGVLHTHLFMLGMFFFLIVLLMEHQFKLSTHKYFKPFLCTYNIGLLITIITLIIRGTTQVLITPLSNGLNAAISGMAGIGHILLAVGLLLFFLSLKGRLKTIHEL